VEGLPAADAAAGDSCQSNSPLIQTVLGVQCTCTVALLLPNQLQRSTVQCMCGASLTHYLSDHRVCAPCCCCRHHHCCRCCRCSSVVRTS
jgi:hypothetical protein